MSFSNTQERGRPVTIKDEGVTLVNNVGSIDFTGGGVTGSTVGSNVIESIPTGAGLGDPVTIAHGGTNNTTYSDKVLLFYNGTTGKISSDTNAYYDYVNRSLLLGLTTPSSATITLEMVKGTSTFRFLNNTNGGVQNPVFTLINTQSGGKAAALFADTTGGAFIFDAAGIFDFTSDTAAHILTNTFGTGTSRLRVDGTTGNVGIGTITTSLARLTIKGSTADSTMGALSVINSSSQNVAYFRNDGLAVFGVGTALSQWSFLKDQNTATTISISNPNANSAAATSLRLYNNTSSINVFGINSSAAGSNPNIMYFYTDSNGYVVRAVNAAGVYKVYTGGDVAANLRHYITSTGLHAFGNYTPTAYLHLPAGTTANAPHKWTSGSLLATPTGQAGACEYDGTNWYNINSTEVRGTFVENRLLSSSATTLTLTNTYTRYIFTGAVATTWTMYALAGNSGKQITIHNRGTASITLNSSAAANDFYDLGATTNTKTILVGETYHFFNDGTYFIIH